MDFGDDARRFARQSRESMSVGSIMPNVETPGWLREPAALAAALSASAREGHGRSTDRVPPTSRLVGSRDDSSAHGHSFVEFVAVPSTFQEATEPRSDMMSPYIRSAIVLLAFAGSVVSGIPQVGTTRGPKSWSAFVDRVRLVAPELVPASPLADEELPACKHCARTPEKPGVEPPTYHDVALDRTTGGQSPPYVWVSAVFRLPASNHGHDGTCNFAGCTTVTCKWKGDVRLTFQPPSSYQGGPLKLEVTFGGQSKGTVDLPTDGSVQVIPIEVDLECGQNSTNPAFLEVSSSTAAPDVAFRHQFRCEACQ